MKNQQLLINGISFPLSQANFAAVYACKKLREAEANNDSRLLSRLPYVTITSKLTSPREVYDQQAIAKTIQHILLLKQSHMR